MSNFGILTWRSLEYKAKFEKRPFLFRSEESFEEIYEESFEDLQINTWLKNNYNTHIDEYLTK